MKFYLYVKLWDMTRGRTIRYQEIFGPFSSDKRARSFGDILGMLGELKKVEEFQLYEFDVIDEKTKELVCSVAYCLYVTPIDSFIESKMIVLGQMKSQIWNREKLLKSIQV